MPRSASISVCNIALSEVRASSIVSIDDATPEARACSTHYDDCLQTLLEAHEWGFAKVRVQLAAITNDRVGEWGFAYQAPADMAATGRMVYPLQTPLSGVYFPWPYNFPRPPFYMSDYIFDGVTLYSNLDSPILEYVSRDAAEARMTQTFKRALTLDLASRLAMALLNDRALKGDLIQQAEAAKRRAMAEDQNRYPRREEYSPDDVANVRL